MTGKEKEILKSRFQQRWGQAICVAGSGQRKAKTAGPKKARRNLPTLPVGICTPSGMSWKPA